MAKVFVNDEIFSDIADEVRRLKNSEDSYTPSEMVTALNSVIIPPSPTGEINISENGTYDVTNYASANVNISSSEFNAKIKTTISSNLLTSIAVLIEKIPLIDTSTATNTMNLFSDCKNLQEIPLLDIGNSINTSYMFAGCEKLATIPLLNTSKSTNMMYMFSNCKELTTIPSIDTGNATTFAYMFENCYKLKNIPLLNLGKATNMTNMFKNCNELVNNDLNTIMQMCINATSYNSTKTLKYIGISSAQATTCQSLSNWSAFVSAGWSTGY